MGGWGGGEKRRRRRGANQKTDRKSSREGKKVRQTVKGVQIRTQEGR